MLPMPPQGPRHTRLGQGRLPVSALPCHSICREIPYKGWSHGTVLATRPHYHREQSAGFSCSIRWNWTRQIPAREARRARLKFRYAYNFSEHGRNYILDLQVYPAQFRLLSFDGQGNVTASNSVLMNGNPLLTATADFNHDGRTDFSLIATQGDATHVTILSKSKT